MRTMERSDFIHDNSGFEMPDIHSSSPQYARRFFGPAGLWFLEIQEQATTALLDGLTFNSALDVGGGHGQNMQLLSRCCTKVLVVGSDTACPDQLRPFLKEDQIIFKTAPLVQTGLPDRSFEIVLSYRMLTHLQNWKALVAELCRLAERSVLIEFPVKVGFNTLSRHFFGLKKGVEGNTRPYTLFDEDQICREFQKYGFSRYGRRALFFWPMALHRLHGSRSLGRLLEGMPRMTRLTERVGSPVIVRFDREEK